MLFLAKIVAMKRVYRSADSYINNGITHNFTIAMGPFMTVSYNIVLLFDG